MCLYNRAHIKHPPWNKCPPPSFLLKFLHRVEILNSNHPWAQNIDQLVAIAFDNTYIHMDQRKNSQEFQVLEMVPKTIDID